MGEIRHIANARNYSQSGIYEKLPWSLDEGKMANFKKKGFIS